MRKLDDLAPEISIASTSRCLGVGHVPTRRQFLRDTFAVSAFGLMTGCDHSSRQNVDITGSKVLIIGDSIASSPPEELGGHNGYINFLSEEFTKKVTLYNSNLPPYNTRSVESRLESFLNGLDYDLIHFNLGIWDISGFTGPNTPPDPISVDEYRDNMTRITTQLLGRAAAVVFATTTPLDNPLHQDKVPEYNDAALGAMYGLGIPSTRINDLYNYSLDLGLVRPDMTHYDLAGAQALALKVEMDCEWALLDSLRADT